MVEVVLDINVEAIRKGLEESFNRIIELLSDKDTAREQIIKLGRDVIRESGYVITSLHSRDSIAAVKHLRALEEKFAEVWALSENYKDLRESGLMNNIASEYVEAEIFYNLIAKSTIPTFQELGVTPAQYVQGLLDVIGEIKRYILDLLRSHEVLKAENLFQVAEMIYEYVKPLDFPDPILPGTRRKTDVARSIIESLRGLLTDLKSRNELVNALDACKKYYMSKS